MIMKYLDPLGALNPKPIASHTAAWITADVEASVLRIFNLPGLGFGD